MATFLDAIGGQWRIGFGLAIAALIAADFMLDYATKIAVLSSTKRECNVLEAEWRELWLTWTRPSPRTPRFGAATGSSAGSSSGRPRPWTNSVRVSNRTNVRCTRAAFEVTKEQYASSP